MPLRAILAIKNKETAVNCLFFNVETRQNYVNNIRSNYLIMYKLKF